MAAHYPGHAAMRPFAVPIACLALAACPAPQQPVPPPAPAPVQAGPPAPPAIVQAQSVWTRTAGLVLRGETGAVTLPFVFMRMEVLRADTTALLVRCVHCPGGPLGWLPRESVVHVPQEVATAAEMELADFALAVRDAALRRDVPALRRAMSRDLVHTLGPIDPGILETLAEWEREGYRSVDRLPFLLDRGIASVTGTAIWAAPPEYASDLRYNGLRAGFRRGREGWEWVFLVSGGM
ncbi:hypothetical protein [Longimicrobium sp.]|jgi:hypothetical protein|uniref:hypothetical protein n=1 Tax=Longimicrobium sp. TaxID=2029185 RepID=UPI002ED9FEE0